MGQQELTLLNVELGESTSVVETYRSLRSLQAELEDIQSLADGPDQDLRQLAAEEQLSLLAQVSCQQRHSNWVLPDRYLDAQGRMHVGDLSGGT